ncbi:MAG: choice-of-anchor Q domain-containing protein [Pyrinomonadaceae bacterium]
MKKTLFLLPLLAIIFLCGGLPRVQAATFTVNNNGDAVDVTAGNGVCETATGNGVCTLRAAIGETNALASDDTITFAAGITTVTLTSGVEIQMDSPQGALTINGRGANIFTIDGGAGLNRIFFMNNALVTITDVALTGGNGVGTFNRFGGAIYVVGGSLTLNSTVVRNNGASDIFFGGGIYYNGGTSHRIINSTFSGNTALQCGGFFFRVGNLNMLNSTVSGNFATEIDLGFGGLCNSGTMNIRNSTITNNSATNGAGGGVFNNEVLSIGNTIIAGNTASAQPEIYNSGGTITSEGNNLVGDSTGDSANTINPITYQFSDILDTLPMLGPLTLANGGTTPTHALLSGSPAIDAGSNTLANMAGLTTDQRGFARIVNGDRDPSVIVDIGSYEFGALAPTAASVTVGGRVLTASGRGIRNVYITMTDLNGNSRLAVSTAFGYYRFEDVAAGETYIISASAKRYLFGQPSQVLNINEDNSDVNFIADF